MTSFWLKCQNYRGVFKRLQKSFKSYRSAFKNMIETLLCALIQCCFALTKVVLRSCLRTASLPLCSTASASPDSVRICHTSGTGLVLFHVLLLGYEISQRKERWVCWGTNITWTAMMVSQGMTLFSKVCLVRYRDNEEENRSMMTAKVITYCGKRAHTKNTAPVIRPTKMITQVQGILSWRLPFALNEFSSGFNFNKELALF